MKFRPILAGRFDKSKAKFPYLATPKVDGIRCLIRDVPVSRSLKPIRNKYIFDSLSVLPFGLDGELTASIDQYTPANFHSTTSNVMRVYGKPHFNYWVFDYVDDPTVNYSQRVNKLLDWQEFGQVPHFVKVLVPQLIFNETDLENFLEYTIQQGYEGAILRGMESPYKFGRSTMGENYFLKLTLFKDSEGVVVDFQEASTNNNPIKEDELGYSRRSSHKENKSLKGTLGALVIKDPIWGGQTLKVSSGLDDKLRQEIWDNREKYLGKIVKYRYKDYGIKDKPRQPTFIGFRDKDDLDSENILNEPTTI